MRCTGFASTILARCGPEQGLKDMLYVLRKMREWDLKTALRFRILLPIQNMLPNALKYLPARATVIRQ
jgi:hypothetical protein